MNGLEYSKVDLKSESAEIAVIVEEIKALKKHYGSRLMILGHHYQRHGIVELADKIGDSFGLAKAAAENSECEFIVFCGVRFMAESAAILCREDQLVYHPEPEAGCPMADMAPMESVERVWEELHERAEFAGKKIIPVTYMNSHAPLKSFTGRHGGVVCTSSNAAKALEWAWSRGDIVFFYPDQYLGRNTALQMGFSAESMAVYFPSKLKGALPEDSSHLARLKLILWNGHCPIHMKFKKRDVDFVRKYFPEAKIVVHPECPEDVVSAADASGSTEFIQNYVRTLPVKTKVFIATEINMIQRLQKENPQIRVEALTRSLCPTMYMVDLNKLRNTLRDFPIEKKVKMDLQSKREAKLALERMLSLSL